MTIKEVTQKEKPEDVVNAIKATKPKKKLTIQDTAAQIAMPGAVSHFNLQKEETLVQKQYNVEGHDVNNKFLRPDKQLFDEKDTFEGFEDVNRIAIPFQRRIVGASVAFAVGNPIKYNSTPSEGDQQNLFDALMRVLREIKSRSFDRQIVRDLKRCGEVAEYWYLRERTPHKKYGYETNKQIRVKQFSPWLGDTLYPVFDDFGDLIAFGRAYKKNDEQGTSVEYMNLWTSDQIANYKQVDNQWVLIGEILPNPMKKIPVIYAKGEIDWNQVQSAIDRIEELLSNTADTNDYHASPILFMNGELTGQAKKAATNKVITATEKSEAKYVSWQQSPESVKMEIEELYKIILSQTQTPDISFESVKGIGALSGVALKILFLDAHLKVAELSETMDEYFERRMSVLKAYHVYLNNKNWEQAADELEIEPEMIPFMIEDEAAALDFIMTASGNEVVMSQETAVARSGLYSDPEAEFKRIEAETQARNEAANSDPTYQ